MVKIIETNWNIISFQSRVRNVESWGKLIEEFKGEKCFGGDYIEIKNGVRIKNLEITDGSIMCDAYKQPMGSFKILISQYHED